MHRVEWLALGLQISVVVTSIAAGAIFAETLFVFLAGLVGVTVLQVAGLWFIIGVITTYLLMQSLNETFEEADI